MTNPQPGWYWQLVGLNCSQGVGVPVQVVVPVDQPEQSGCSLHSVWLVIALQGVMVPVQGVAVVDQPEQSSC